jgi:hypothetical protein
MVISSFKLPCKTASSSETEQMHRVYTLRRAVADSVTPEPTRLHTSYTFEWKMNDSDTLSKIQIEALREAE